MTDNAASDDVMPCSSAIALLTAAAAELAQIHRGKHYALWREDIAPRLGEALAKLEPFRHFRDLWIFTGDGGGVAATTRFGEWAVDLLVQKQTPEAILAAFWSEVERNAADYSDVSPVFGVQVDGPCELGDGVTLAPVPENMLAAVIDRSLFQPMLLPTGTSLLYQPYTVTPAFERGRSEFTQDDASVTAPKAAHRVSVRQRVRLACLLASIGPVEIPITALRPDRSALFAAGHGNISAQSFGLHPLVSFPVEATRVTPAFAQLGNFREGESLTRAIDRLGRARLARSPVDRALELGIAAEIALMHDHSPANTEITHRMGSRAAWLIGRESGERETVFSEIKMLYQARSQAVHSGALSSKSVIDLDAADRLVTRVLCAILARGSFPNWHSLTMGGNGQS